MKFRDKCFSQDMITLVPSENDKADNKIVKVNMRVDKDEIINI